jgi:hypothetical protein
MYKKAEAKANCSEKKGENRQMVFRDALAPWFDGGCKAVGP